MHINLQQPIRHSIHDSTEFSFGIACHLKTNVAYQGTDSWGAIKNLINGLFKPYTSKELVPTLYPVKAYNDKREDNNIQYRTFLALDFDDDGDINEILTPLSGNVYFAYTTYHHQQPKKGIIANRYRIILPLRHQIPAKEWLDKICYLKAWSDNLWTGNNAVDSTCFNLGQLALLPATNPNGNNCKFWTNDGDNTDFIDLNKIIAEQQKLNPDIDNSIYVKKDNGKNNSISADAKSISAYSEKNTPEFDPIKVIDILLTKSTLVNLNANWFTKGNVKGITRTGLAAALIFNDCSYSHFEKLDEKIRKVDSNTSTFDVWQMAKDTPNKHSGLIESLLSESEKQQCRHDKNLPDFLSNESNWNKTVTVDYISRDDIGYEKKILLCADMGVGKNHLWSTMELKKDEKVIVLAPLKSIAFQQGSSNMILDIARTGERTFVYDQSKNLPKLIDEGDINPEDTILVIDECHNISLASYRHEALRYICHAIHNYDWKQVIFQSATITSVDFDSIISFDSKVKVHKHNGSNYFYQNLHIVNDNDRYHSICNIIKNCNDKNENTKVLVLLNDKKKHGRLKGKLDVNGINVITVNSEKINDNKHYASKIKDTPNYKMSDDNIDVLIGTSCMVEGINIQDEIENAVVIVVGEESWQYIQQLSGRFRKAKKIYTYHIADFHQNAIPYEEFTQIQNQILKCNADLVDALNTKGLSHYYDELSKMQSKSWDKPKGMYYETDAQKSIQNKLSSMWIDATGKKNELYKNIHHLPLIMKQQKFQSMPDAMFCTYIPLSTEEKKSLSLKNKKTKERKEKMLKAIRKQPVDEVCLLLNAFDKNNLLSMSPSEITTIVDDALNPHEHRNYIENDILTIINASWTISPGNTKALKTFFSRWIDNKKRASEFNSYCIEAYQSGNITYELRQKYSSGTMLTRLEQNNALEFIIERMIERHMLVPGFTKQMAFNRVMSGERFNRNKSINLVGNKVVSTMKKPSTLLNHFLPVQEGSTRLNGKKTKVQIVI